MTRWVVCVTNFDPQDWDADETSPTTDEWHVFDSREDARIFYEAVEDYPTTRFAVLAQVIREA